MKVKILNIIDKKTFKAVSMIYKKHHRYEKYITVHKKYLVDLCGNNKVKIGDDVEILSSKPFSKTKKWILKI